MMIGSSSVFAEAGEILASLFGSDVPPPTLKLHQVAARAALIFLIGLAVIRIGKNRMVSRVTSLDVLFGFMIGSLLSRGITGNASISGTTVACVSVATVHWLLEAIAFRWHAFGIFVKGRETLLVRDGELITANLRRMLISKHDLQEELRLQGVEDIKEVHHAYEERNGEVSVLKETKPQVLDVAVEDGVETIRIQIS